MLSYTDIDIAWNIYTEKKQNHEFVSPVPFDGLNINIKDEKVCSYLKKYSKEYRENYIVEVIKKEMVQTYTEEDPVHKSIIIILCIILLFEIIS